MSSLIDGGLIKNLPVTRFRAVVDDLSRYIPGIGDAVHVGSSFVVRAVLAHQEATDARPTRVENLDAQARYSRASWEPPSGPPKM